MSNLIDLLQEFNVPYRESGEHGHTTAGWVQLDCPQCSPDSGRFRLGVHLSSHATNCWSCGRLSTINTLAEILKQPWGIAKARLGLVDRPYDLKTETPQGKLVLPNGRGELLDVHQQYLRARGYDVAQLQRLWGIEGIGLAAKLAWRVFIPIHYQHKVVSWTTRSLTDGFVGGKRYLAAKKHQEAIPHKNLLYGADYCRHAIVVVEGPTDVWRVGPGAAATFGTAYTPEQVNKIAAYPVRVVCYDADNDAQRSARRLCWLLESFPGQTHRVVLEGGKDPGNAPAAEIQELRQRYLEAA